MKHFNRYLPALLKSIGFVTIFVLLLYLLLSLVEAASKGIFGFTEYIVFCVVIWLILVFGITAITMKTCIRMAPVNDIYAQKGVCDEYAAMYKYVMIDSVPNSNQFDRLVMASIYIALRRYPEAEYFFNTVTLTSDPATTNKMRIMYYNDRFALLIATDRLIEARQLYDSVKDFMGKNLNKDKLFRVAWCDNYLSFLMHIGAYDEAVKYYNEELQPDGDNDLLSLPARITMVEGAVQNRRAADAELMRQRALDYINNITKFKFEWQKQYYFNELERVYAPASNYYQGERQ